MRWLKEGYIFAPNNHFDWMASHASVPIVDSVDDQILRVYFGTRDKLGRSHTGYINVDASNPKSILYVHDKPILPLGRLGTFDDNGIMPSWIVNLNGRRYLYYIGWNPQVTVSYRVSIGLAISDDNGSTWRKVSEGPICDRTVDEPYFSTTPCVLIEGGIWKMWYTSCTGWEVINGHPEPFYNVKYAESADGIRWRTTGRVCIDYDDFTQAISRPCVFIVDNHYRMLYSYRSASKYRTDLKHSYRLGFAESTNGVDWTRRDDLVGIERSSHGWDSEMMCNCSVQEQNGNHRLFYNGNGFGRSGFGYAKMDESLGNERRRADEIEPR